MDLANIPLERLSQGVETSSSTTSTLNRRRVTSKTHRFGLDLQPRDGCVGGARDSRSRLAISPRSARFTFVWQAST